MDQAAEAINETVANNATRIFNTETGIASAALFFMAILPIYIGAHRSIAALKKSLEQDVSIKQMPITFLEHRGFANSFIERRRHVSHFRQCNTFWYIFGI